MNIALCGYGRMGREIERQVIRRGHSLVARIDPRFATAGDTEAQTPTGGQTNGPTDGPTDATIDIVPNLPSVDDWVDGLGDGDDGRAGLQKADCVIDFSQGDAVLDNLRGCAGRGANVVIGTTGWSGAAEAQEIATRAGICCVAASNFSVGAHLLLRLTAELAKYIVPFAEYDIMVSESHHRHKKDSPSGTAKSIADTILAHLPRKTDVVDETLRRPIGAHELHVVSQRGGEIIGQHTITVDSPSDTLELRHVARNRGGFALGAVYAAEWLEEKRRAGERGFFTIDSLIENVYREIDRERKGETA